MSVSALDEIRKTSTLTGVWETFYRQKGPKSFPGVDGVTPEVFHDQSRWRIRKIQEELGDGYQFSALRGLALPKKDASKLRLICVPTIADRIIQRALLQVIEAEAPRLGILNRVSYGFVRDPGGEKRGVRGAHKLAVKLRREAPWAFKADIRRFFDTIPRERLVKEFCGAFGKRSLFPLIRGVVGCEVDADGPRVKAAIQQNEIVRGVGLRQGMPLSPILSNFLLRKFDATLADRYSMIRYADDLIVFCRTEAECAQAKQLVEEEITGLGLTLNETKTKIHSPSEPVDFLGMDLAPKEHGGYHLVLAASQLKEIRSRFRDFHDIEALHSQGMDAAGLFRRLDQMRRGFLTAYEEADNIEDIENRTRQWIQECAQKVYGSIFTMEAISRLTAKQKKFLMLP